MKTLKFSPKLVPLILSGKKTSTWRLFDDKDLQVGDRLVFVNKETGEEFANAEILSVKETIFCKLTEEDWAGQEKFSSDKEMYATYSKYYSQVVDKNSSVKIIKFKLV